MSRPNTVSPKFRSLHLHQVEIDRKSKLQKLNNQLQENEQTYLLFGFKADERQENMYIKEFQKQKLNIPSLGVMNIADLWSNKQINRFIDIQNFTKDKFLLSKLSKQKQRYKLEKQEMPVKFHFEKIQNNRMSLGQIIQQANKEHNDNIHLKYKIRKFISNRAHSEHL